MVLLRDENLPRSALKDALLTGYMAVPVEIEGHEPFTCERPCGVGRCCAQRRGKGQNRVSNTHLGVTTRPDLVAHRP